MDPILPFVPETFERRITFTSAKNWLRPNAAENYGHIGMTIQFALIGPEGAVSWLINPWWYIQSTRDTWVSTGYKPGNDIQPEGWDLAFHSYTSQDDGKDLVNNCEFLSGGKCYCSSTSLGASKSSSSSSQAAMSGSGNFSNNTTTIVLVESLILISLRSINYIRRIRTPELPAPPR